MSGSVRNSFILLTNTNRKHKYKKKFFIDMKSETYSTFSQYCGYAFKNDQSYGEGWGIKSACLTS